jgi:hypothetical protein
MAVRNVAVALVTAGEAGVKRPWSTQSLSARIRHIIAGLLSEVHLDNVVE